MTALLEYLDLSLQEIAYYANYALQSLQNARIIPYSSTPSLCSKFAGIIPGSPVPFFFFDAVCGSIVIIM